MMHNPPHPDKLLGEDVMKALGLKIAEIARRLGVLQVSLSMQVNYDLAAVQQQPHPSVRALDPQAHHHKSTK